MTAGRGLEERFLVPRWRTFAATRATGELDSPRDPHSADRRREFDEPEPLDTQLFHDSPGLHMASDLLDRALHGVGDPAEALPASSFVLESSDAPAEMRRLADAVRKLISGEEAHPADAISAQYGAVYERVRTLRAALKATPRNPVLWMDLALAQTLSGELWKATRSVQAAITLAPHNRFILRSASRFFVHIDDPERARAILSPVAAQSEDPWLLAAEIATSEMAGTSSRLIVPARRNLRFREYAPAQASELACAIASHEINAGQDKIGRRLVEQALEQPTENTVAQAEFDSRRARFTVPSDVLAQEGRFEAQAVDFASRAKWQEALSAAKAWQDDQPFATDPAMYLSYLAAVCLEDYATAEQAASRGLTANPGSSMLGNNLAFALVNLGRPDDAAAVLDRFPASTLDDTDQPVRTATLGLISFRLGDPARGRSLYEDAFNLAIKGSRRDQAAFAASYWAREEVRIGSDMAESVLAIARAAVEGSMSDDAKLVLERVEGESATHHDAHAPLVDESPSSSPTSWR